MKYAILFPAILIISYLWAGFEVVATACLGGDDRIEISLPDKAPPESNIQTLSTLKTAPLPHQPERSDLSPPHHPTIITHSPYMQHHKGLPVMGGQIIKHYRKSQKVDKIENYYRFILPIGKEKISRKKAVKRLRAHLGGEALEEIIIHDNLHQKEGLLVFPADELKGDFRLAYRVTFKKDNHYSITGIVDAYTGEILMTYCNVKIGKAHWAYGLGNHYCCLSRQ